MEDGPKSPEHRGAPDAGAARGASGAPLVGRTRELALLREAVAGVFERRGRLVLLGGDPGIGKTRLAEQVATEASARGAWAVTGRCQQGAGAPTYWPWVMVLRDLAERAGRDRLRAWLGTSAAFVAPVVPEIVGEVGAPDAVPSDALGSAAVPTAGRASDATPRAARSAGDQASVRFEFFDAGAREATAQGQAEVLLRGRAAFPIAPRGRGARSWSRGPRSTARCRAAEIVESWNTVHGLLERLPGESADLSGRRATAFGRASLEPVRTSPHRK